MKWVSGVCSFISSASSSGDLVAVLEPLDDVVEDRRQEDAEERHAEHAR